MSWHTVSTPGLFGEFESRADEDAELRRTVTMKERKSMGKGSFAGKGTSFPINKPEDVSAAAHALGRAGPGNLSTDRIKANIIRIAKAKGWASHLPEAWRQEDDEGEEEQDAAPEAEDEEEGDGKKPFAGAAPKFKKGSRDDDD